MQAVEVAMVLAVVLAVVVVGLVFVVAAAAAIEAVALEEVVVLVVALEEQVQDAVAAEAAVAVLVVYRMVVAQRLEQPAELELVALEEQVHRAPMDSVDLVDNIDSWIEDADTLDIHIEVQVPAHTAVHILDSISQKIFFT